MIQFFIDNWQVIFTTMTSTITGFVGWFMGKKERRAKLTQEQGTAVETAQRIYDTLMDDMRQQYERIKEDGAKQDAKILLLEQRERDGLEKRATMEGKLQEMGKQIAKYESRIAELKKENADLKSMMQEYEHQVQALQKELSQYQTKIDAN